ncbi:MAG: VOC family protein [Pseudomonadota bacterium]
MKRIHMGVVVEDFDKSLKFYTDFFDAEPTLLKDGYARWMLDDPRVNFNINVQGPAPGIDHVGIQVESDTDVAEAGARLRDAGYLAKDDNESNCGYAEQTKVWVSDPQGVVWETFHSKKPLEDYGENDLPDELISELRTGAGATAS